MFGKELFIWFNVHVFHGRLSNKFCMCPSVPFGIVDRVWVVIVLIPDHCLSIYFTSVDIWLGTLTTYTYANLKSIKVVVKTMMQVAYHFFSDYSAGLTEAQKLEVLDLVSLIFQRHRGGDMTPLAGISPAAEATRAEVIREVCLPVL